MTTLPIEARLSALEDRMAIYNVLATHPLSADTGDRALIDAIYTEGIVFDRGHDLDGARGRTAMAGFVQRDQHRAAIAGGLAHFGSLPLVDVDGDTAIAISYLMLITPDPQGREHELPNHGRSTGYRVHRVLANRWSLNRYEDGWRIAERTVLPADGQGPAVALLREAGRRHVGNPG